MWFVMGDRRMVIRIMPYPPSFSRTAASTMEPAMGASTWALGSHRCRPYNGILTINALCMLTTAGRWIMTGLIVLSSCSGYGGLGILASFVGRLMQLKGAGIQLVYKIRSIGLR